MEPSCCNGEIQVETKSKDTHRETRPGSRREGGEGMSERKEGGGEILGFYFLDLMYLFLSLAYFIQCGAIAGLSAMRLRVSVCRWADLFLS